MKLFTFDNKEVELGKIKADDFFWNSFYFFDNGIGGDPRFVYKAGDYYVVLIHYNYADREVHGINKKVRFTRLNDLKKYLKEGNFVHSTKGQICL